MLSNTSYLSANEWMRIHHLRIGRKIPFFHILLHRFKYNKYLNEHQPHNALIVWVSSITVKNTHLDRWIYPNVFYFRNIYLFILLVFLSRARAPVYNGTMWNGLKNVIACGFWIGWVSQKEWNPCVSFRYRVYRIFI